MDTVPTKVQTLSAVGFDLGKKSAITDSLSITSNSVVNNSKNDKITKFYPRDHSINISYQSNCWIVDQRKWYLALVGDNGLLDQLDGKIDLIVMRILFDNTGNKKHLYSNFVDYFSFWHYYLHTAAKHRCFNEVAIESQCQKLRFDLDMPGATIEEGEILITKLAYAIYINLVNYNITLDFNTDIILFQSHDIEYNSCDNTDRPTTKNGEMAKLSYHLIVNNYACLDQLHLQFLTNLIVKNVIDSYDISQQAQVKLWLDDKVSNKNHPLRIYGSIKPGTHRVKQWKPVWHFYSNNDKIEIKTKLIINNTINNNINNKIIIDQQDLAILQASLLSWTKGCKIINVILPKIENVFDVIDVNDDINQLAPIWLKQLELDQVYLPTPVKGNRILLLRKTGVKNFCHICQRNHTNQNAYFIITKNEALFKCFQSNDTIKVCNDTSKWVVKANNDEEDDEPIKPGQLVRSNFFDVADRLSALEHGAGFLI